MRLNQCDCCGKKFGLVVQRLWTRRFCSMVCKRAYLADRGHVRLADFTREIDQLGLRIQGRH
jgi:hypothetical protein